MRLKQAPPRAPSAVRDKGDAGAGRPVPPGAAPTRRGTPPGVISVEGLSKTYPNGTKAVQDISFEVKKGEIFGILGPNGAGKSTTIGVLGTLVKPTAGRASVDGLDVTKRSMAVRRRIGFAMQEAGVDELAKGIEYLLLQARLYGIRKKVAKTRAERLLRMFEIEHAAKKRVGGYSGGMKRRIDLAAALIHEPPIVFLDEPTEGLDPRSRRTLWDTLKKLNRDEGRTILLSTHYMDEADYLCDRLAIMEQGRIVVQGTPAELKASVGGQSIMLEYEAGTDGGRAAAAERVVLDAGLADRIQHTGREVHVYVPDAGKAVPSILRALDRAGLAPDNLAIRQPSLEDVYLKYTGRTLEAAERSEKRAKKDQEAKVARRRDRGGADGGGA